VPELAGDPPAARAGDLPAARRATSLPERRYRQDRAARLAAADRDPWRPVAPWDATG
jgi:hypothetical protein